MAKLIEARLNSAV